MATITIQTPNVTKNYSLDAAQVQRLLGYATATMTGGDTATTAEKEAWVARQFMILMRDAVERHELLDGYKTVRANNTKLPVTEA